MVIWCIPVIFGALSVSSLLLALVSTVGSAILLFQDTATGLVQMGAGILSAGIFVVAALITWELGKRFVVVTTKFSKWLASLFQKMRGVKA